MKLRQKAAKCRFELASRSSDALNSNGSGLKIDYRPPRGVKTRVVKKKLNLGRLKQKSEVLEGKLLLDLPIRTVSEANCFERWQVKHRRHKDQQKIVALFLNPLKGNIKLPCKIMLTRFAPDELDVFDNLPMSFKYIVDAICAIITGEYRAGKADSDRRISIACDQVKSDLYGIRVVIAW